MAIHPLGRRPPYKILKTQPIVRSSHSVAAGVRAPRCPMRLRQSSSSSSSSDCRMSDCSSSSSASSVDEDEINTRVYPCWQEYRGLILRYGYRLDTYRDVKEFYENYWKSRRVDTRETLKCKGYLRACAGSRSNEDALCRDAGLVSI